MMGKPRKVMNHGLVRWQADARDPTTGKRTRPLFATRAEAVAYQKATAQMPHFDLHPDLDPLTPFASYAARLRTEKFVKEVADEKPRSKSLTSYDWAVTHASGYIVNPRNGQCFGGVPLPELRRSHVTGLILSKLRAGYAPDSVRIIYANVRAILNCAIGVDLLGVNPADKLPAHILKHLRRQENPDERRSMTEEHLRRFMDSAKRNSRLYSMWFAGYTIGARLGELCGLLLDDFDVPNLKVEIARSLGQTSSMRNPTPGPTKGRIARPVDISKELAAMAEDIKADRPALAMARGWRPIPKHVWVTRTGRPISERFAERDFKRVLRLARSLDGSKPEPLPDHYSPHSLRHTFACMHLLHAKDRNVIQYVQQQLGHSSIKVTVDTYGSAIRMQDPEAADRLVRLAFGAFDGSKDGSERAGQSEKCEGTRG